MSEAVQKEFLKLVDIIAVLRGEKGCPWDKQQTHSSLRQYLLEECYEALEALDQANSQKLSQELGDILLQIMLHSQIAAEEGEFGLEDVIRNISQKLVRRHPHVFGSVQVKDAEEVSFNWESIKKTERQGQESMLESVPKHLPALAYSQDVQRRVAQVGFDWENIEGVIDKLAEEVRELKQTVSLEEKADEFGDLMFTLVNIARRMGVDSESALRDANRKFSRRFAFMEKLCRQRGLDLGSLSFDEQNRLWQEAKNGEKRARPEQPGQSVST
ncbi:MAG TPA: nucleoside triphosphate pyrophosphohydrolase [Dehalococcoidales bacterium]|nr:nucleoside triphosphate pyrophosphohydrolase [Dehalococcoidales bacterium]